jgi:hypothetical protein
MKKSFALVFALAFALVLSGVALANPGGGTVSQQVSFEVTPIKALAVSGDPQPLVINSASAGQEPDDAIDSSTSYSFTANYGNTVIFASLDSAMPLGVTLSVQLAAPVGGSVSTPERPATWASGTSSTPPLRPGSKATARAPSPSR